MTGVAGLSFFVHQFSNLFFIRGENYLTVFVENPDLLQTLLLSDGFDNLMHVLT